MACVLTLWSFVVVVLCHGCPLPWLSLAIIFLYHVSLDMGVLWHACRFPWLSFHGCTLRWLLFAMSPLWHGRPLTWLPFDIAVTCRGCSLPCLSIALFFISHYFPLPCVLWHGCPLTWLSFSMVAFPMLSFAMVDIVVFCHRCPSSAPASKLRENENSNDGVEDEFTWKDVLKAVLRLRQKEKLSEGEPGLPGKKTKTTPHDVFRHSIASLFFEINWLQPNPPQETRTGVTVHIILRSMIQGASIRIAF